MAGYHRSRRGNGPFAASAVLAGAVLAAVTAHGAKGTAAATATGAGRASASAAVTTGQRMAAAYGWGSGGEWSCLDALWTRESSWNPYAANPTSDARGIPQDINGWNDFAPGDVHAQVAWGLSYVRGRYGDACTAWSHETSDSWY